MSLLSNDNYYDIPANSSSILKHINPDEGGSPQRYFNELHNLNKRKKDSISIENGKAIHLYKLEPELFDIEPLNKPTEMAIAWGDEVLKRFSGDPKLIETIDDIDDDLIIDVKTELDLYKSTKKEEAILSKFKEYNVAEYIAFKVKSNGKLLLTSYQKTVIDNAVRSIELKDSVRFLFEDSSQFLSHNEKSLFFDIHVKFKNLDKQIISFKSKLDRVRVFFDKKIIQIIDIKTSYSSAYQFNNFLSYRVYRQLAVYRLAICKNIEVFGFESKDLPNITFEYNCVVIETTEPFNCAVHNIHPMWISKGTDELKKLCDRLAFHQEYGYEQSMEEFYNNGELLYDFDPTKFK